MKIMIMFFFSLLTLVLTQRTLADENEKFLQILDQHWDRVQQEKIFYRTDPDAFRLNGTLPDFSDGARKRRRDFNQSILSRIEKINPEKLSPVNEISYKLFIYERTSEAKSYNQPGDLFPINKLFGYHTYFADAPKNMSFLKLENYEKYLVSLADFPRYNQQHITLLKEAVKKGFAHYCQSMQGYEQSISQHIVDSPQDSSLFIPFANMPKYIDQQMQIVLRRQAEELIANKVIPEYQALYDFYTKEYMPNCRTKPGISSAAGGADYYQSQIEFFTTTTMDAKQIHQLGLSEVKRIRSEMQAVIDALGFKGNFKDFLEYLRNEPKFYATTELELLSRTALIAKNAEGELPKFFSVLPRGTYKIKPGARGAYYVASSGDGLTSGTYFIGAKDLKSQPFYNLEALTLHEGVPGHHLQSALALELNIPEFRKTLYHAAFGEGWGLYSERLGKEMGFYQDPYSDFGRLTYEVFRAVRLVVDTGVHAFGWSRERAIAYMLDNTALSQSAAEAEIDRYITWPAQALSYKIGELKIRALREKAERTLGANFDIREFHTTLIGSGSLPISVLEELVEQWLVEQ